SGMLIGMRINVSMLLGTLLSWVVAPFALREAGILDADFNRTNVLFWVMWPATGMMVVGGLTALLLRWKVLRRTFQNLSSTATGGEEIHLHWVLIGVVLGRTTLVVVKNTMLEEPVCIPMVEK